MRVLALKDESDMFTADFSGYDVVVRVEDEVSGMHFTGEEFTARIRAESRSLGVMQALDRMMAERFKGAEREYVIDSYLDGYMIYRKDGRNLAVLCVDNCVIQSGEFPPGVESKAEDLEELDKEIEEEMQKLAGPGASLQKVKEVMVHGPLLTVAGNPELVSAVLSDLERTDMPKTDRALNIPPAVIADFEGKFVARILDISARFGWRPVEEMQAALDSFSSRLKPGQD